MRTIFTDKLSNMVAHYENLRDMYGIWIEHIFWHKQVNTCWGSEEESIQYHGQDLLAEKTLSVTLNDIGSRNEVWASRHLTLKNNSSRKKNKQT